VTERTREIGIRKAVGASQVDIMLQFVIEAVLVTVVGGVVGIAAGVVAARAASGQDFGTGTEITAVVTTWSVAIAFGVSALIGLFFGIYPAMRASRLDPIEALRSGVEGTNFATKDTLAHRWTHTGGLTGLRWRWLWKWAPTPTAIPLSTGAGGPGPGGGPGADRSARWASP
jgi:predicted lysophospholipase L1 biosynthesis ABC-type transport system permease subunit